MIGNWMLTLTERLDHESRLLPYVLSGLTDECPTVQTAALQLLEQLGAAYEKEHEKELLELIAYGGEGGAKQKWNVFYGTTSSSNSSSSSRCEGKLSLEESGVPGGDVEGGGEGGEPQRDGGGEEGALVSASSTGWAVVVGEKTAAAAREAAAAAAGMEEAAAAATREAQATISAAPITEAAADDRVGSSRQSKAVADAGAAPRACLQLPGPFASCPGLGVRRLVQSNFCRVAGALAAELGSWQAEPRAKAAQLLLVNLVVLEDQVAGHLHLLLPGLCKVGGGGG